MITLTPELTHTLDRLLHYTSPRATLHELDMYGLIGGGGTFMVVGDPDNGAYEWALIAEDGHTVKSHSDRGYGIAAIALRDGLCEVLGAPEEEREPPEPDGEDFRGGEAAAYLAEQQHAWQRLK